MNDQLCDFSAALNAEGVFQPRHHKCMGEKVHKDLFFLTDLPKK